MLQIYLQIQRHQIWRALFGDTPVQSITSPFMLTPTTFPSENSSSSPPIISRQMTSSTVKQPEPSKQQSSECLGEKAPPKMGFVPRGSTIHLRDDIRQCHDDIRQHHHTDRPSTSDISVSEHTSKTPQNNDFTISGHNSLEQFKGQNCMTLCTVLSDSVILTSLNHDTQFDSLRSEADLTCF